MNDFSRGACRHYRENNRGISKAPSAAKNNTPAASHTTTGESPPGHPLSRQLELLADGARDLSAAKLRNPPPLDEARLQMKLDGARQRLRELVVLGMKPSVSEETRQRLREAESWTREQVRLHFRTLERFRKQQRQTRADRPST
jgi:hypothetical protein